MRDNIILKCTECGEENYINTKNKRNKQKTASEIFVISLAAFRYMWKK